MRFTTKGLGWLIFGGLVIASATESHGVFAVLSTIVLGLVFIAIYVMRQFFKPRGLGWYILGGMLLAFCVESGYNSDTLISLVVGLTLLAVFYLKNKDELLAMVDGIVLDEPLEAYYQDAGVEGPEAEDGDIIEIVEVVEEVTETDDLSGMDQIPE